MTTSRVGIIVLSLNISNIWKLFLAISLAIDIPRDREGSFEPQFVPKHQTRWTGFDDKIISLYSRGMTVPEIQTHLTEMVGTKVSPALISTVTDAVMDDVKQWQSRPLDAV